MPPFPLTSDFAARLAAGLAASVALIPRGSVPPAFLRTLLLVVLGLTVGACLTMANSTPSGPLAWAIAAAVVAYLASAAWGLGLPRVAMPMTLAVSLVLAGVLAWASLRAAYPSGRGAASFALASRLASSAFMGTTLASMLLGHHYLTAPSMTIEPLKRLVAGMAGTLAFRSILAAAGLVIWSRSGLSTPAVGPLFLGMRWGMGVIGPAVAVALSWQTLRIRSTQSATGILYIGMTLVLFGELAGMILGRDAGIEL